MVDEITNRTFAADLYCAGMGSTLEHAYTDFNRVFLRVCEID